MLSLQIDILFESAILFSIKLAGLQLKAYCLELKSILAKPFT